MFTENVLAAIFNYAVTGTASFVGPFRRRRPGGGGNCASLLRRLLSKVVFTCTVYINTNKGQHPLLSLRAGPRAHTRSTCFYLEMPA